MNEPKRIRWVLDALTSSDNLNEWEDGFVQSVSEQFAKKGLLTEGQYDKLEEIYARKEQ